MFRRSVTCFTFLSMFVLGLATAHADDTALHTYKGFAGTGLAGVGGEVPDYTYYIELDEPLQMIDGQAFDMLLTNIELPVDQRITVCGQVAVQEYNGVETHYSYAALTKITGFEACE